MKLDLLRRATSPSTVEAEEPPVDGVEESAGSALEWTGPQAWLTKTISWSLIAAVAAGPVALVLALVAVLAPPASDAAGSQDAAPPGESAAVSAFASDAVTAWLSTGRGQERTLDAYGFETQALVLPEDPWRVSDPLVSNLENPAAGVWRVTVALTVAGADDGSAVRRYFQIPVVYANDALSAAAVPTPVAAPRASSSPALAYRSLIGLDSPLGEAAGEFLMAHLTSGSVTRVVTPGAHIRPVTPAPFKSVAVDRISAVEDVAARRPADGDVAHVLVTGAGTASEDKEIGVQYALTMTARGGRWETTSIDVPRFRQSAESNTTSTKGSD